MGLDSPGNYAAYSITSFQMMSAITKLPLSFQFQFKILGVEQAELADLGDISPKSVIYGATRNWQ